MSKIPVHLLKERTNLGFHLKRLNQGEIIKDYAEILKAHRDDHYNFFIQENGSDLMMVDFNEVRLTGNQLYYILPLQVHHRILKDVVNGWFIAVDTALITAECRNVFESSLLLQQPYTLSEMQSKQCNDLMILIQEKYLQIDEDVFQISSIHALLQSFLATAAGCYVGYSGVNIKASRLTQLTSQFKALLVKNLCLKKSPSDYAAMLNVSEAYLSEALKKTTGFPVSYWIHQEVMMEAKRLLYYSQQTVKEIAHHLGYSDHSYFSRSFRKITGLSAVAFRDQYRK
ncbi:AraC family transcriptional regulator [Pedobacter sp. L105]|uniref:helix-turn-helix domain-containing protein n=1 Tax=Pedobacter sp. L105 TaxID=1641871 RepID=UPI00131C3B0B|nr:AraC family transcriptional regulator [Pedobacter sp. L105]